jgi:hypothetical protein
MVLTGVLAFVLASLYSALACSYITK